MERWRKPPQLEERRGRERGPVPPDCPKKKLVNAVQTEQGEGNAKPMKIGVLRVVNTVQGLASSCKPLNKELLYIDVTFNCKATRALVQALIDEFQKHCATRMPVH